ncbi:hypothetical protein [Haloferula sp.]|uniref:hypothetical protein n=1 Tax=Haloferula sp. TaxID=2497595 RepID=UPI00329A7FDB
MNKPITNKLAGSLLALSGSLSNWKQMHGNLNQTGISAGSLKLHGGETVDGEARN